MSSNYQWQKQQAHEQVHARLQEAEAHRRTKANNGRSALPGALAIVIPALVGAVVAIWLLTGCAPYDGPVANAAPPVSPAVEMTMADRVRFQDKLEASRATRGRAPDVPRLTMADRILFQDERSVRPRDEAVMVERPAWTMAARLRFHDRLGQ
jgi:hypothetical protein